MPAHARVGRVRKVPAKRYRFLVVAGLNKVLNPGLPPLLVAEDVGDISRHDAVACARAHRSMLADPAVRSKRGNLHCDCGDLNGYVCTYCTQTQLFLTPKKIKKKITSPCQGSDLSSLGRLILWVTTQTELSLTKKK